VFSRVVGLVFRISRNACSEGKGRTCPNFSQMKETTASVIKKNSFPLNKQNVGKSAIL